MISTSRSKKPAERHLRVIQQQVLLMERQKERFMNGPIGRYLDMRLSDLKAEVRELGYGS